MCYNGLMIKNGYFDYVAFFVYLFMMIAFFLRTPKASKRRSLFSLLLILGLLTTLYDICAIWIDIPGTGAYPLKYLIHCLYIISRNLITPVFMAYLVAYTDTWHKFKKHVVMLSILTLPIMAVVVLTILTPFNRLIFYIDSNGMYTRGDYFFVLYVSAILYVIFCVVYSIKYYCIIEFRQFIPICSVILFQLIAVAIQFFYPYILCEMLATSLAILLMLLTVERPEAKIDRGSGMLKSSTFSTTALRALSTEKPVSFVLVNMTNHSAINSYVSFSNMEELYSLIRERIESVTDELSVNPEIYNLESGLIAVTFYDDDIPYAVRFANHLLEKLKDVYNLGRFAVSIPTNVCVLKSPDDTKDFDEINAFFNNFRGFKYTGEVMMASSFIKGNDYTVMANMDSILKDAIANDLFEVYYQPIYSTKEKQFKSAEALIRLFTKEYGFIRPDLFIPLSEDSGAIHEIGMIVFEKVCKFIASDEFKTLGLDYIEVNLSTVQCSDKDLVTKINAMLNKYNVSPSQINLEITETASAFLQKNMLDNIDALYEMGFSFSLDDFGTGYSNMIRISSLPLHIVKFDKSFTWTENNDDLKLILRKSIQMVKKMDMKIVVEGVETKEMLDTFVNYDCEYIQGYYFSKPLPEYDFVKFVSDYAASHNY